MKKQSARFLSLLLSLTMVIGMLPGMAYATEQIGEQISSMQEAANESAAPAEQTPDDTTADDSAQPEKVPTEPEQPAETPVESETQPSENPSEPDVQPSESEQPVSEPEQPAEEAQLEADTQSGGNASEVDTLENEEPAEPLTGECGATDSDKVTWTLDAEGTMTISGTGAMADYSSVSKRPWHPQIGEIKAVKVTDGVTKIGKYAFRNATAMTSLELADSVTVLGPYSFRNVGLTEVTISDKLTDTKQAFYGCESLTKVTVNGTRVSPSTFQSCDALTDVTLADTITEIGDSAFYGCSALTSIQLPSKLTTIGEEAFNSCSLEKFELPESVTSLGAGAFGSNKFTSIVWPERLTEIPNEMFSGCYSLTSVELPNTLTSIGSQAFGYCKLDKVELPESVTRVGSGAFCSNSFTSVVWPKSIPEIPASVFNGCRNLTSIEIPEGVTSIGSSAFYATPLTEITLPSTLTSLGEGVFQSTQITEITIPSGVKTLPKNTFQSCKKLKKVNLSEGMTSIGEWAFYQCELLESLDVPSTVTQIDREAFRGCSSLESVTLPDGLQKLDTNAFWKCVSLKEITVPAGIDTSSVYNWMRECTGLEKATIGSLCQGMFDGCTALKEVTVLDGTITTIPSTAFSESGLEEFTVPEGVTEIGDRAFSKCANLTRVSLPASLEKLSTTAFENCPKLTNIELAEGFHACTIENGVIYENDQKETVISSLPSVPKELTLPDTVKTIGNSAFANNAVLTKIIIPEGVTSIGDSAFYHCDALTSAQLPESLTTMGTYVFAYCGNLNTVNLPQNITVIPARTFFRAGLIQFTIPEGVTEIGDEAFEACDRLETINFPSTLTTLGKNVFGGYESGNNQYGCTSLYSIELPEGITKIGANTFQYATSLAKATLPESLTEVGNGTFYYCTSLTDVKLPSGMTVLPAYTFGHCESLKTVKLPENLTEIGNQEFYQAGIEEIDIPASVTKIGSSAFGWCKQLKELTVPDGVTSLDGQFAYQTTSLTKLVLPTSVTTIGSDALTYSTLQWLYFKGTEEQWSNVSVSGDAKTVLDGVIIVCGYDPNAETPPVPVVTTQPVGQKAKEGDEVKLSVTAEAPEEGAKLYFTWMANTTGDVKDGGTRMTENIVSTANSSTITVPTDKIGTVNYYCQIVKIKAGAASVTTSDLAPVAITPKDWAGEGTAAAPLELDTAEKLQQLYNYVADGQSMRGITFKLTADIELPVDWVPIGTLKKGANNPGNGTNILPFSGTIDGDNHTLTVAEGGLPLLGYVRGAVVRNLNIYGKQIAGYGLVQNYVVDYGSSGSYGGGIYADTSGKYNTILIDNVTLKSGTSTLKSGFIGGYASGSNAVNIINCKAEPGVTIGYDHQQSQIGTFAGAYAGYITSCVSYADVYGVDQVGGLVGYKGQSMGPFYIRNNKFYGTVHASGKYAGGIVGCGYTSQSAPNTPCVTIENCYSNGDITAADGAGGILGAEGGVEQCWDNGIGYIRNNCFAGTLTVTDENGHKGGIIGWMNSLNKHNIISNNYYLDSAASKGIGGVKYVDTSAIRPRGWTEDGVYYLDSSKDDLSIVKKETNPDGAYTNISKTNYNRTDDPLGKDADSLTMAMTAEQFKDGTLTNLLNKGEGGFKNWEQGELSPDLSEQPIAYKLELSGKYQTEYYIGDTLNTDGMAFTATWSNGSTTDVAADQITFTGFDSSKRQVLTVTASYGAATCDFTVTVLKRSSGNPDNDKITVNFTLLGDDIHGDITEETGTHTLKRNNLNTWLEKKAYTLQDNATVWDLLKQVARENDGVAFSNPSGNYVDKVTFDGNTLGEFDNGQWSGWMYTRNGKHPLLGVSEQFLENGDVIVWHYTDDYREEEGSENWSDENYGGGGGGSSTATGTEVDQKAADPVISQIQNIGTVTKNSGDKIQAARAAYNKLTDAQKKLVTNYNLLTAAEKAYAALTGTLPFTDVSNHWAKSAIQYAYQNGLFSGISDTEFGPNVAMNRAMLVTVLYRMENEPNVIVNDKFTDVASNQWYAKAVAWANANNIVSGYSDTAFGPTDVVTREQMASILYRYAQFKGVDISATNDLSAFTDKDSVSDWALTAMQWANASKLINGRTSTTLAPQGNATRAEVAQILMTYAQNAGK